MRHYEPVIDSNFISESTALLRHAPVPEAKLAVEIPAWGARVEALIEKYPEEDFTNAQRIGGLLGWLEPETSLSRKAHATARKSKDYAQVRAEIDTFLNERLRLPLAAKGAAGGAGGGGGAAPMDVGAIPVKELAAAVVKEIGAAGKGAGLVSRGPLHGIGEIGPHY